MALQDCNKLCTQDFAKACVFFAAEASDAVTGQSLSVDGGLTMP